MLDELEWPSLEARRDQSSLLLFHKIHCGAVSIEKDKYMTPAHSLKTTRSSHSAQYRRQQTYSDALKNSFFPRTIPHWNCLPPSVANTQSTEEFRARLAIDLSICILTRPVVITGFNRSLLVDWWSSGRLKKYGRCEDT